MFHAVVIPQVIHGMDRGLHEKRFHTICCILGACSKSSGAYTVQQACYNISVSFFLRYS